MKDQSIPVSIGSKTLSMPWAGGLNNPQVSNIDLNFDGIKDVFIFDRSNAKIYTFINHGNSIYSCEPSYEASFPALHDWVLLVDYNGDGKEDIYTSGENIADIGISVYRNDSKLNQLKFTQVHAPLLDIPGEKIYISQWDVPGITDIDRDGDMDILNFDFGGAAMYLYKNNSFEKYGVPDSLDYVRYDACWGKFVEDFGDCSVTLNISCKGNKVSPPNSVQDMHAGSTILAFEGNGDHSKELLIGDVICPYMYKLTNIGDSLNAIFTGYDKAFPPQDPVNVTRFPAAFLSDIDNDGNKDLLVAPNALNVSNDIKSLSYYRNDGDNSLPDFRKISDSFLQDEMIDVGENSYPAFFDENGDGLLDIVIGNFKYFVSPGIFSSRLALYRNTGTIKLPSYTLVNTNWLNLDQVLNIGGLFPSFGDLDGDGDEDMLVGDANGNIHYFENTAGTGKTATFVMKFFKYLNIDVGQNACPQIVDVDGDALPDLLIGEKDGNVNYYRNTSTSSSIDFTLLNAKFGNINVKENDSNDGLSVPFLCNIDSLCNPSLYVGSGSGKVFRYPFIGNNLSGTFSKDTMFTKNIREGSGTSIAFSDMNDDGIKDMLVGNRAGGLSFYRNTKASIICSKDNIHELPFSFEISPNPAKDKYFIKVTGTQNVDKISIHLFDALAKSVEVRELNCSYPSTSIESDISSLPEGMYFYKIKLELNSSKQTKEYNGKIITIK